MAAAYVLPLADSRARNEAINRLAGAWSSNNVTAAVAWVRQLPDGPVKNQAIKGLHLSNSAPQDIPGIKAYAETLPAGTTKDELVKIVAQQLACQNPEEGLRWVRSQLTGRALNTALQTMAFQLTGENSQQAAAIITSMTAGAERDSLIDRTAASLAKRDPAAAIAWADQLPDSSTLEPAWQAIAQHWAKDHGGGMGDVAGRTQTCRREVGFKTPELPPEWILRHHENLETPPCHSPRHACRRLSCRLCLYAGEARGSSL